MNTHTIETHTNTTVTFDLPHSLRMAFNYGASIHLSLDKKGLLDGEMVMEDLDLDTHLSSSIADYAETKGIPCQPILNSSESFTSNTLYASGLIPWFSNPCPTRPSQRLMIFSPPCEGFRFQVAYATKQDTPLSSDVDTSSLPLMIDAELHQGTILVVDENHYSRIIFDGDPSQLNGLPPLMILEHDYGNLDHSFNLPGSQLLH